MLYDITPVPAPRMTKSDKWRNPRRPCVQRYFDFKDAVKKLGLTFDETCHVIFYIKVPQSWSNKKKNEFYGRPHCNKPDIDNLWKALGDAVHDDDSMIWRMSAEKRWANHGCIEIQKLVNGL